MRFVVVVATLVGLAAPAHAQSFAHGAWIGPVSAKTANEVVARMRRVYATAAHYTDHAASVVQRHAAGSVPSTRDEDIRAFYRRNDDVLHERRLKTAFVRPTNELVVSVFHRIGGDDHAASVLWFEAGRAFASDVFVAPALIEPALPAPRGRSYRFTPVSARAFRDPMKALTDTRVTLELPSLIPALLLDGASDAIDQRFAGAMIDGVALEEPGQHPCWVVRTNNATVDTRYHVDQDSYLIRRVTIDAADGQRTTIVYEPSLAVPADDDLRVPDLSRVKIHGDFEKSAEQQWLGLLFDASTPRIRWVARDSSAASSGIRPGDHLRAIGGRPVSSDHQVRARLAAYGKDESVVVDVARNGIVTRHTVVLTRRPRAMELQRSLIVGQPLRELVLRSTTGSRVAVAARPGQSLVLVSTASWCKECVAALPTIATWERANRDKVTLISITDDFQDAATAMMRTYAIAYPVWLDNDHEAWRALATQGLPTTIVIDRNGIIRDVASGFDPAHLADVLQNL